MTTKDGFTVILPDGTPAHTYPRWAIDDARLHANKARGTLVDASTGHTTNDYTHIPT